jgi:hypothetical protein
MKYKGFKPFTNYQIEQCRKEYNAALRHGKLLKQDCQECNFNIELPRPTNITEGHHDDYTKPLTVVWLCRDHHIIRHKQLGWR